jgi:outer membrane protein insertion porin family
MRARIFSHSGDVYNENALERDFMALWNTGFFDDIRLEVTDSEKGGKIVTFFVREKKLVRSIDYKGLSSVEQSDVLDEFKKDKVGSVHPVPVRSRGRPAGRGGAAGVALGAWEDVRHRPAPHAEHPAQLRGPDVYRGGRPQGEGRGRALHGPSRLLGAANLQRAMKYSRACRRSAVVLLVSHKTYDKERIEADLENIRDLYRDHGYYLRCGRKNRRRRWWTPGGAGRSSFTAGAGASAWI